MTIIDTKLLALFITIIVMLTVLSVPSNSKLGEIYFKSFKYDLALEYYNKSNALDSNSPKILKQLRDYFLVQGEVQKALQMQNKVCDVLSRNENELLELAKLYDWNNMPYEGLKTKERLAALYNGEAKNELLSEIAQGYRWLRRYDDADRLAELLGQTDKIQYLLSTLEYYVSSSNFPKVIELTDKITKLGVHSRRFKLLQAQSFEAEGKIHQSIIAYKKYLSDDVSFHQYNSTQIIPSASFYADNLRTYEKIIDLHQRQNDEVILKDLYSEIFTVVPSEYEIALSAAVLLYKYKETNKLTSLLEKIYSSTRYRDLYRSGDIYRLMGMLKDASRHLEKAYSLSPRNTEVIEALADVYEELGENKKALRLQYKLLKILEKKERPSQSYRYIFESEYYALLNGPTPISRNRTRIKNTQKKILFLLEKIGDKKERHKELIRFVERYPLDTQIRVELAYSYLDLKQEDKALIEFKKVLEINNQDRDAVLFIVDHYIQDRQYTEAKEALILLPDLKNDFDLLNRKEAVYRVTDPELADKICDELQDLNKNRKNYSYIELKSRCFDQNDKPELAIELIQNYLKKDKTNKYARISLGYYYLKAKDFEAANNLIKNLESKNENDTDLRELKRQAFLAENNFKKQRAWYFTTYIHLFSEKFNGLSFWDYDAKILKNFYPFSFGVSYSLQNPFYTSDFIDDLKLHINLEKNDSYFLNLYLGKNLKNNNQLNAGLAGFKALTKNVNLNLDVNYRKQVYELNSMNLSQLPTVSNADLSLSYSTSSRNTYNFSIGFLDYEIFKGNESHQYARASLGWDHAFSNRFSAGPFAYQLQTLSSQTLIKTLLPDFISIQCINGAYWHKMRDFESSNSLSNRSTGCLGLSTTDDVGTGVYFNYSNITNWYIDENQDFEFRVELDQSIYQDLNQFFNIYIGYNKWYF